MNYEIGKTYTMEPDISFGHTTPFTFTVINLDDVYDRITGKYEKRMTIGPVYDATGKLIKDRTEIHQIFFFRDGGSRRTLKIGKRMKNKRFKKRNKSNKRKKINNIINIIFLFIVEIIFSSIFIIKILSNH